MSFKIGQFRKSQINNYEEEKPIYYQNSSSPISSSLDSNEKLTLEQNFKKGILYYFKFKTIENYSFSLVLRDKNEEKEQPIKIFNVPKNTFCSVYFIPNDIDYCSIVLKTDRTTIDYATACMDKTYDSSTKKYNNIYLSTITDIVSELNIPYMKKIGIQGPPGLAFCLNGDEIHIGKNGIYETDKVNISSLGFKPNEDDYFIVDYLY